MYRIIGADGKEYGPVPATRLRQWIAEGRANARTRARLEEETEWRTLGEIPEFQSLLAAQRQPARLAAPAKSAPGLLAREAGEQMAEEVLKSGRLVDIGSCFSRAWQLLNERFWLTVAASAVVILIYVGLLSIPTLGSVAALVLVGPLFGGLYWFFLKVIRGQPADVGDVFAGFTAMFVPLMLAGLVQCVLVSLGLVLCIVPGIYLTVIWVFSLFLIIDKRMDFWPAMELSRRVVHQDWWNLFGLTFISTSLLLGGVLLFCIGIFVTAPLAIGALAYAYEDLFRGVNPPPDETAPRADAPGGAAKAAAAPASAEPGEESKVAAQEPEPPERPAKSEIVPSLTKPDAPKAAAKKPGKKRAATAKRPRKRPPTGPAPAAL